MFAKKEKQSREVAIWTPQEGPQTYLLLCPIQDILYGGARGGGKTDGALGHWLAHVNEAKKHAKGLFIRRTTPELEEVIARAKDLFEDVAEWKEQKKMLVFKNSATLKFRFLEKDSDAGKYQGHSYTWICIEEAGNFPSPEPLDMLRGTLRSAAGVITWYLMTANPGGCGHNWLKARYIDTAPPLTPFEADTVIPGETTSIKVKRIFIPSLLKDNKKLMEADPNYKNNVALAASGKPWLYKAWMNGDWNIVAGGMFDDAFSREVHVLQPFTIPRNWDIYRSFDWGQSKPFSIGWWARSDGSRVKLADGSFHAFPKGSLFRIHEYYGWTGEPNVGLASKSDKEIAREMKETERLHRWSVEPGPADPMIFNSSKNDEDEDKTIASFYAAEDIIWEPAEKGSRMQGWRKIRTMLLEAKKPHPEEPCLYVFDTCLQWIRTVPALPRSPSNMDDVDTDAEDHAADETRYMVNFTPCVVYEEHLTGS